MENGNNRTARSRGALMMYIFGIFSARIYLGMAYMFLFSRVLAERMSPTVRYVMEAYSCFTESTGLQEGKSQLTGITNKTAMPCQGMPQSF